MRMLVPVVTWRLESGGTSRTKYQKPSFLDGLGMLPEAGHVPLAILGFRCGQQPFAGADVQEMP
jgi:hypothetical protein